MITPQEIQEKTFVKAVFGGYDMASVDEFLEPLTSDYISLYKEITALKSKMKVLVETIEEYRREEESVKKALVIAQKSSDELMAETQKKCNQMVSTAEALARAKSDAYKNEAFAEEERLNKAKQLSQNYFDRLRSMCSQQLQQVNDLAAMEVHIPSSTLSKTVYNMMEDTTGEVPVKAVQAAAEPIGDMEATRRINISEVEGGSLYDDLAIEAHALSQSVDGDEGALPPRSQDVKPQAQRTSKFEFIDLQFGKDYDPKGR